MDGRLIGFLIRAKQATYAGRGAETIPSREKSHDLIYRDGDHMYYDTYLGTGKFAGEEALWIKNTPLWTWGPWYSGERRMLLAKCISLRIRLPGGSSIY